VRLACLHHIFFSPSRKDEVKDLLIPCALDVPAHRWISAVVMRPLAELFAAHEKQIQQAASKGVVATQAGALGTLSAPSSMLSAGRGAAFTTTSLFNGQSNSLFPPTTSNAPSGMPAGQAMSVSKWLEHPHSDHASQVGANFLFTPCEALPSHD